MTVIAMDLFPITSLIILWKKYYAWRSMMAFERLVFEGCVPASPRIKSA